MSRMSNSWAMMKASARVLRLDSELLVFPLLSGLAVVLMTATAVPLIILASSINEALVIPVVVSFAGGYFFLCLATSALKGIYSAALYRFATTGSAGEHFDATLMERAFRPKKRRW